MTRTKGKRAAIYTRLSYSATDAATEATLARQEDDCRALADRQGYEVVAVYRDTDSAYSGKRRRGYEDMTAAAQRGEFDTLIVWRSDRLYRRVKDLVDISERLATWVRIEVCMGGEIDLSTAEGRLRAGMLGQISEYESAAKAERVRARIAQRATQELRHASGGRRTFGWVPRDPDPADPDRPRRGGQRGYVIERDEAKALREVYRRLDRGESMHSVTRWLNARHTTPQGRPFARSTMRSMLISPRNAGLVAHHGEVVGEAADGLRIVDPTVWYRVRARLTDPARVRERGAGRLLAGIARCTCGATLLSASRDDKRGGRVATVRCPACGWSRLDAYLTPLVVAAVGEYLARHADRLMLAPAVEDGPDDDLATIDADLRSLDDLLAAGTLRPDGYARAQAALLRRRDDALAQVVARTGTPAAARLLADPRASWERMAAQDVEGARAVLREVVDHVEVARASRPSPEDVVIAWR